MHHSTKKLTAIHLHAYSKAARAQCHRGITGQWLELVKSTFVPKGDGQWQPCPAQCCDNEPWRLTKLSCINNIVSRPIIREHHLVIKLPYYFVETTSSKSYLSKSVTLVTPSLLKTVGSHHMQPQSLVSARIWQSSMITLLSRKNDDSDPCRCAYRPHIDW